jgi:hypothetical protein
MQRRADALVLPDEEPPGGFKEPNWHRHHHLRDHLVAGRRVIVVQAKFQALSMTLLGQGVFSLALVRAMDTDGSPAAVASVMLCTRDDSALFPFVKRYPGLSRMVIEPVYSCQGGQRMITNWRPGSDLVIDWA